MTSEQVETKVAEKKKSKARKTSELPSRVFVYGVGAPVENVERVADQIFRSHRYYNDFTAITRGEIEAKKALQIQTPVGPELAKVGAQIASLYKQRDEVRTAIKAVRQDSRRSIPLTSEQRDQLTDLDDRVKVLQERQAQLRKEANTDLLYKEQVGKMGNLRKDLINETPTTPGLAPGIRSQCGLYTGTADRTQVAADVSREHAMKFWTPPRFHRWQGDGSLAVRIKSKGGIPVSTLYSGTDRRIQIVNEVRTRTTRRHPEGIAIRGSCWLKLRIGSDERMRPIWAKWPMIMHRPLPEDAILTSAVVIRRKIGTKETWEVHFSIEAKSFIPVGPDAGATPVAVHLHPMAVGSPDGLLVAMAMDAHGKSTPCTIPIVNRRLNPAGKRSSETKRVQDVKDTMEHANGLRAQRDKNFNEIRDTLRAEMDVREVPEWLTEALRYMSQWKQQVKLVKVASRWRHERFNGDENMYSLLDTWRRQDKHLYQWESCERHRATRHRRALYRNWARDLARKYPTSTIVIENINLANMARKAKPEDEDLLNEVLRSRRPDVAVGELREALKHAFFGRVTLLPADSRGTKCPVCNSNLKGSADSRECRKCDVLPTPWFGRCWQLLRDAGHSVDAIQEKWQMDAEKLRQMIKLKESTW